MKKYNGGSEEKNGSVMSQAEMQQVYQVNEKIFESNLNGEDNTPVGG